MNIENHKAVAEIEYYLGIDIGSTTVKIAILDNLHNIIYTEIQDC